MTGKTVYLFNSAPSERPAYRRGVLDSLAYPPGHRIVMSYRRTQVQPELLTQGLTGRDAAIIFVDYQAHGADHGFIPIRFARIVQLTAPPNSARIEVRVEFGELVPYRALTETDIRKLQHRPKPPSIPGKYYFALEDTPILQPTSADQSEVDTWENLAKVIAQSKTLSGATLLYLSGIRKYGQAEQALHIFAQRDRVYRLRPSTIYEMDVRVFESAPTEVEIHSSSDLLAVAQAFPTTVGGLGTYRVILSSKRTLETSLAVLTIQIVTPGEKESQLGAMAITAPVRHSRPIYLVQIAPSSLLLGVFVLVAFAGVLFTSLSKDFFKANPALTLGWESVNDELMAKMVGSALLALAAWLGFRKLPGGGG